MDYMTLKEASKIWGVTPRWINYYLSLIHISEPKRQVQKKWGRSGLSLRMQQNH